MKRTMKKIVCLLIITALSTVLVEAGPVSEQAAQASAEAFLASRGKQVTSLSCAPVRRGIGEAEKATGVNGEAGANVGAVPYYVFNVSGDGGFVVVSGDDRTTPILGYADAGSLSEASMPDGLSYMLELYAAELEWMDSHVGAEAAVQAPARTSAVRASILPLIQTRWNQSAPYNDQCPEITYQVQGQNVTEHAATGCVATSMAQVMYYHRGPTGATTSIPGYTTRNGKSTLSELLPITFAWNDMALTYDANSTDAAKSAVATLMRYCGQALEMNYNVSSVGGSSAYNEQIPEALKLYFGYDDGVQCVQRYHYSYTDWIDLIYNELAVSRPVIFGGQSAGGGHSFVCDGYDRDDYFHFNWGWGGSSDGYFRLSLLNPWEQGIGGSSTLDGFGYGQDAIIGIRTTNSGKAYCLCLSKIDVLSDSLTFSFDSYGFGTGQFDYAVLLFDANDVDTLKAGYNQALTFGTSKHVGVGLSRAFAARADGTYSIRTISRKYGTESWQSCHDGEAQPAHVTKAGETITVDVPVVGNSLPSAATISVTGNLTAGYEQSVTAHITGGTADYHGDLILRVNGTAVMGKQADIPAGQTVDVHFAYTPNTAGENTLALFNSRTKGTQIGSSETVTIEASDVSDAMTLSITPSFVNVDGGNLYANAARVSVSVTNPDTEYRYVGKLSCSLREYESAAQAANVNSYIDATAITKIIELEKNGGTTTFNLEYDGLTKGHFYRLRVSYHQSYVEGNETKTRLADVFTEAYEVKGGYVRYAADGTKSLSPTSNTIDCESAACVDLTDYADFNDVTVSTSTNQNCLYLLRENAETPSALSGKNVVKGNTAQSIELRDEADFFSPVSFTAEQIRYYRTFTLAANGTSGWNTLFLPFDVSTVTCEDLGTVDWFHSGGDTGKNFWLREYTGDASNTVYFEEASSLNAYTPYIIAVPDGRWGDSWRMTNRLVTFHGSNAVIEPTGIATVSGNNYTFSGNTATTTVSKAYVLNAEGSSFEYEENATTTAPFRAWFRDAEINSLALPALMIGSGSPTKLDVPVETKCVQDSAWYTIDGKRLTSRPTIPGFYIHNGQKLFIR